MRKIARTARARLDKSGPYQFIGAKSASCRFARTGLTTGNRPAAQGAALGR
jgi:hypothetical protein